MEINMINDLKNNNKLSAALLTVAICVVLAAAAIIIAVLNPQTDFDFIPSYAKPGEVHFSEMKYSRPDTVALKNSIDELIELINENASFSSQSNLFSDINIMLSDFYTMQTIANIHFYSNNKDDFWSAENSFVQSEAVLIHDKTTELLDVIAASGFKSNYERSFFGSGYFNDWVPYDLSNAAVVLLLVMPSADAGRIHLFEFVTYRKLLRGTVIYSANDPPSFLIRAIKFIPIACSMILSCVGFGIDDSSAGES